MPSELTAVPRNRHEALRELLRGGEAYATTLVVLVIDRWGTEAFDWHPGTLRTMLEEEFAVELPALSVDRLMAGIAVLTTDQFWQNAGRFVQLANVLAGTPFDPTTFDPADAVECAWAITEALLLDPPDDGGEPFSDEVRAYVTEVLKDEGFVTPPDVLRIALDADFSAQVTYDLADDPELFQGMYKVQQDKSGEVESIVREHLIELVGQLRTLPLEHGNTSELEKKIAYLMTTEGSRGR